MRGNGVSLVTGWRWRKKGWVETLNIAGKLYITGDEIDRFNQRAKDGEFSKEPTGVAAKGSAH